MFECLFSDAFWVFYFSPFWFHATSSLALGPLSILPTLDTSVWSWSPCQTSTNFKLWEAGCSAHKSWVAHQIFLDSISLQVGLEGDE